jgi:hypothetical protein
MKPFAVSLQGEKSLLGFGLSAEDLQVLKDGGHVTVHLDSVGVGLWETSPDGGRRFIQPRNSRIVVIVGDSKEEIGRFLKIDLK